MFIYGKPVRNNAEILSLSGSGSKGQLLASCGCGAINLSLPVSFTEISKSSPYQVSLMRKSPWQCGPVHSSPAAATCLSWSATTFFCSPISPVRRSNLEHSD